MYPSGSTSVYLLAETGIGTYPGLCISLQRICRATNANTGGLLRFVRGSTWFVMVFLMDRLFMAFFTDRLFMAFLMDRLFGGLGSPLFWENSYALLVLRTWKGTNTADVFSG